MLVPNNADQTPSISRNTLIILRRTITNICSFPIKNNHVLIYINLHWVFYVLSPHGVYQACTLLASQHKTLLSYTNMSPSIFPLYHLTTPRIRIQSKVNLLKSGYSSRVLEPESLNFDCGSGIRTHTSCCSGVF